MSDVLTSTPVRTTSLRARRRRGIRPDVHGDPRQPRHDQRAPGAARAARRERRRAAVVRQRVHAGVRERDPHRVGARRPVRPAHRLRHRHRGLRHRLGARRAQHRSRAADRGPGAAGLRRRRRAAAVARAHRRRRRARAPAARDRHLGRHLGPRRRGRTARRRRGHGGLELAGDLLDQRPGRASSRSRSRSSR